MKNVHIFAIVVLVLTLAVLACSFSAPTGAIPQGEGDGNTEPTGETAGSTAIPVSSPIATTGQLQLEIVQYQAWTDRDGNARANVLMHNPYDFPVAPAYGAGVSLLNNAGEFMRGQDLYFLDGISGGGGFILPGETIAANACFTCEEALLTEEWGSVEFTTNVEDATGGWDYSTEVEATIGDVSFDGDSPIFWITGTVKNNSATALGRISFRLFVFDQEGNLVGAAEASAWDVGPGVSASIEGYGIGQAPDGPVEYEVSALGVNY